MIFIQNLTGMGNVQVVFGHFRPGQRHQPVKIGTNNPVLCGGGRQACQALQFTARLFIGLLGHFGFIDLFAEFLRLYRLFVFLTQFALDGLHLLTQEVFSLNFLDLLTCFVLNFLPQC